MVLGRCMVLEGVHSPGGLHGPGGCMVPRGHGPGEVHGPGGVHGRGGAWCQEGAWSWGVVPGEDLPTATAAGGTHSTGMHSCF